MESLLNELEEFVGEDAGLQRLGSKIRAHSGKTR